MQFALKNKGEFHEKCSSIHLLQACSKGAKPSVKISVKFFSLKVDYLWCVLNLNDNILSEFYLGIKFCSPKDFYEDKLKKKKSFSEYFNSPK